MNEAALTDLHDLLTAEYRMELYIAQGCLPGRPCLVWSMPDIYWLRRECEAARQAGKLRAWLDDWNWFKGLT